MKKLQLCALGLFISLGAASFAQEADVAPVVGNNDNTENTNALFDPLFNYDLTSAIGTSGNAGVAYTDGQFWISAWASSDIHVLDQGGNYVETFSIPGLSGTRSFTSDGVSLYAGTAALQIYELDPVGRVIDNTINIVPSTDAKARMCAYDPTLDGGNGGFWVANFTSDIAAFDMNGAELSVIDKATHGLGGIYGGAVDVDSPGGPYLWVFAQGQAGGMAEVHQLQLPGGTPTGVIYDYNLSGQQPTGNTSIAGGLFISDEVVPGTVAMIGVGQGTPNDQLFGVELTTAVGVGENSFSSFNLYPNPARGQVNIETAIQGEKKVAVYDILGKLILNTVVEGSQLNISALNTGVYTVSVTQNGATITKKLVVQ